MKDLKEDQKIQEGHRVYLIYIYSILEVQILCEGFKRLSPPNMNLMVQ